MGAWVRVAEFTKAKHLKGGLVARSVAGLPFLLEEGLFCAFVPPVIDVPRQGTVVEVRPEARGGATVFFDTVVDANQADALVGCYVLARREDLPDDVLELQEGGIEGFTVVDAEAGAIGTAVATCLLGMGSGASEAQSFVAGSRYGYVFGLVLVVIVFMFSFFLKEGREQR